MRHEVTRVRHVLQRRRLVVRRVEAVTPGMTRVVLGGEALAGFVSAAPDDHLKLIVPGPAGEERRDYTPRHYDAAAGELTVDFALHEAGVATGWARGAAVGDSVEIAGPRGSLVVAADFDWWLLVGDETALPAMGRRVEELPAGVAVVTLAAVIGPAEEQRWTTAAQHRPLWVHRPAAQADDPAPVLRALEGVSLPPGDGFVWIAAEARVARAVRSHVLGAMAHPVAWTRASGYWIRGEADGHASIED